MTAFAALLAEARAGAERFGHREHVRLTWLAVTRHGAGAAAEIICAGLSAAAPREYHATISRAWVEIIAGRTDDDPDFDSFIARCPDLLDKRLLERHYLPGTLAAPAARTGWVPPDRRPW